MQVSQLGLSAQMGPRRPAMGGVRTNSENTMRAASRALAPLVHRIKLERGSFIRFEIAFLQTCNSRSHTRTHTHTRAHTHTRPHWQTRRQIHRHKRIHPLLFSPLFSSSLLFCSRLFSPLLFSFLLFSSLLFSPLLFSSPPFPFLLFSPPLSSLPPLCSPMCIASHTLVANSTPQSWGGGGGIV